MPGAQPQLAAKYCLLTLKTVREAGGQRKERKEVYARLAGPARSTRVPTLRACLMVYLSACQSKSIK